MRVSVRINFSSEVKIGAPIGVKVRARLSGRVWNNSKRGSELKFWKSKKRRIHASGNLDPKCIFVDTCQLFSVLNPALSFHGNSLLSLLSCNASPIPYGFDGGDKSHFPTVLGPQE